MQVVIGDELARHLCLLAVVAGAKRDVMHRTTTQACARKARGLADVDDAAHSGVRTIAHPISLTPRLDKSQHAREHGCGRGGGLEQEADAMKTANGLVFGNGASLPSWFALGAGNADQRKVHAIGIGEGENGLSEALGRRGVLDARIGEALGPSSEGRFRYAESRGLSHTNAAPARRRLLPREKSQDRAGATGFITKVEVIGTGIVKIHRLLDAAKPQRARVERQVSRRFPCYSGDVMNTLHKFLLLVAGLTVPAGVRLAQTPRLAGV
jgi:hypothetical protein